jgi:ketosteroid isomerase-like protein
MKTALCVAAVGVAMLAGNGWAADTEEAAIRAVLTKAYDNWSAMNVDANDAIYASDTDTVWFDIAPLKYQNWTEYKAGVKKLFDGLESLTIKLNDDLVIHRRGNWAWVAYTFEVQMRPKGGKVEGGPGRGTDVLEKRGNQWVIVHEHVSMPAPL